MHSNVIRLAATAVAATALVASLATSVGAAPKPGFPAGTWIGKGTITGRGLPTAGPPTVFSGKFDFVMKVGRDGSVSGTGSWYRKMVGTGAVSAVIVAKTRVKVAGDSTQPRLVGTYRVVGTFSGHGVTNTSTFAPVKLSERLVITRAGACKVTGRHTFNGVTTQWAAQLKGSGTCLT